MIQVELLDNGDFHPTGRWYKDYAAMDRDSKARPELYDPDKKYMVVTPSKVMNVEKVEATVVTVKTTAAPFPGYEKSKRKPRAKKEAPVVERPVGDGLDILPKLTDKGKEE